MAAIYCLMVLEAPKSEIRVLAGPCSLKPLGEEDLGSSLGYAPGIVHVASASSGCSQTRSSIALSPPQWCQQLDPTPLFAGGDSLKSPFWAPEPVPVLHSPTDFNVFRDGWISVLLGIPQLWRINPQHRAQQCQSLYRPCLSISFLL